jgi:hypothetical protein
MLRVCFVPARLKLNAAQLPYFPVVCLLLHSIVSVTDSDLIYASFLTWYHGKDNRYTPLHKHGVEIPLLFNDLTDDITLRTSCGSTPDHQGSVAQFAPPYIQLLMHSYRSCKTASGDGQGEKIPLSRYKCMASQFARLSSVWLQPPNDSLGQGTGVYMF